jgi:hypothetical protein
MVRRHFSDGVKEMVLSMSLQGVSDMKIREYTGINDRSLRRWQSTYLGTGRVSRESPGRSRMLNSIEAKVHCSIL